SARSRTFGLAIDRIAIDEEAHPKFVKRCVNYPDDQTIDDVTDERAEQFLAVCERPVRLLCLQQRLERERPEEPPKDAVGKAPTGARSVAANVALEKQAERRANDDREKEVQAFPDAGRRRTDEPGNEWKEMRFLHPLPESPAADDACEATSDECARETERPRVRMRCGFLRRKRAEQ